MKFPPRSELGTLVVDTWESGDVHGKGLPSAPGRGDDEREEEQMEYCCWRFFPLYFKSSPEGNKCPCEENGAFWRGC